MTQDSKLSAKMKLIAKLCADPRLSNADFRGAVAMLATFHNNKDGKCYPSHPQVAEASATGERSAERAAAKLKALGYCSFDENKGGRNKRNDYDFSEALKGVANGPLIDENPVRVTTFKKGETSSTATRNLVNTDKKPRQGDDRSKPSNKPIYKPRGEGSPLPRDSAASPSPKKATGLHQEKVVQMREINPATLAKMAPLHLKCLPIDQPRWKEGDPDPEPTEQERRELLAIVNGADIIPMKAKPPPIIIGAALVENRSAIFPATPEAVT